MMGEKIHILTQDIGNFTTIYKRGPSTLKSSLFWKHPMNISHEKDASFIQMTPL